MNGAFTSPKTAVVVASNNNPTSSCRNRQRGLVASVPEPQNTLNGFASSVAPDIASKCLICDNRMDNLINLKEHPEMRNSLRAFADLPSQSFDEPYLFLCFPCISKINIGQDMRIQMKKCIKRNLRMTMSTTANSNISIKISSDSGNAEPVGLSPPSSPRSRCSLQNYQVSKRAPKDGQLNILRCNTQDIGHESLQKHMPNSAAPTVERVACHEPPPPSLLATNLPLAAPTTLPMMQPCADTPINIPLHPNGCSTVAQTQSLSQSMLDVYYVRKEPALITESGGIVNKYDRLSRFMCKKCKRTYQRKHFYTKHMLRCRPPNIPTDPPTDTVQGCESSGARNKKMFPCNECCVTVESASKLRKHKLIHLNRFYCSRCGNQFSVRQEYEFHCVQCLAKQVIANLPAEQSTRPITRAQSRAATVRTSIESVEDPNESDDDNSDNEAEVSDDSECDTMYTKRMRYTDHWVEFSRTSLDDEYFEINSSKEYDLYLLDNLRRDLIRQSIPCSVPFCAFEAESHFRLMRHEFCDHGQKLLFFCKKCGNYFTRKVHLDFHLHCQNGGRYTCFRCGDIFEFQDQLDRHLIKHTKNVNYRCSYCKFEFLTEDKLLAHCSLENHDPNGERKLISIVSSMTIINPTPPSPNQPAERRQYKVHIMPMNIPQMQRDSIFNYHFRRQLQVGDVNFKGQLYPNCASCILYG